jgi:hypothetical protein
MSPTLTRSGPVHASPGPRGGNAVVSSLNPMQALLGGQAPFADKAPTVRGPLSANSPTRTATRSIARAHAGLSVSACLEPLLDEQAVTANRRLMQHVPDARALYLGLSRVVVWHFAKPND